MDLTQIIAVVGVIVANIVTIITLYIHLDNKTDSTIKVIHSEMKDFHGRMEKIDAEFKGRMATQDAEFKGRLLLIEERLK